MASIRIQNGGFMIEVTGDERFVGDQFVNMSQVFNLSDRFNTFILSSDQQDDSSDVSRSDKCSGFSDLFSALDDGLIGINMAVPGSNKAEKIKNVILLICYYKDGEWVPTNLIVEECKRQGCWDSSNFAAYVKQCAPKIMITGKGNSKAVKITVQGKADAEIIIKQMLGVE